MPSATASFLEPPPHPLLALPSPASALHIRGKTEAGFWRAGAGQGPPILELQLQRELDLPRGRGSLLNDPARGAVCGAVEDNLIRVPQIRVIQNIERLGTELQIQSLTDSHSLQERGVDHEQAGATQRAAPYVSEGPLGRQHKGSRIEPLIRLPHNHLSLEVRIPTRYVGITGVASTGN